MAGGRVTEQERALMRRLRADGLSTSVVATRLGRSQSCVKANTAGAPTPRVGGGYDVTNREREAMRAMRAQGLSLDEVGAALGRSAPCVSIHTRDLGVQCRPGTKGLGAAGYARLLKLADEGMAYADLAERFGLKRSSVPVTVSRLRRQRREASASQEARAC
ncbi:hypothetical protein [Methylorubrum populi]